VNPVEFGDDPTIRPYIVIRSVYGN